MLELARQAGDFTDEDRAAFALARRRAANLIEAIGDQVSDRFADGIVDEIIEIFERSGIVVFPE
jgi:hypothetical protein